MTLKQAIMPRSGGTKRVICTCLSYGCGATMHQNRHNIEQPGKLISITARKNHRKRDSILYNSAINEEPSDVCLLIFLANSLLA